MATEKYKLGVLTHGMEVFVPTLASHFALTPSASAFWRYFLFYFSKNITSFEIVSNKLSTNPVQIIRTTYMRYIIRSYLYATSVHRK